MPELCVILYALPLPLSKSDYCYTLHSCGFVCLPPVAKLRVSFFSMTPPPPQNAMLKHHHLNSSIPQMEALDIQHCLKGGRGGGGCLEPVVGMYPAQRSHTDNLVYKAGIFRTWPRSHSNAQTKTDLKFRNRVGKGASG